jgi:hypothetical protein
LLLRWLYNDEKSGAMKKSSIAEKSMIGSTRAAYEYVEALALDV